MTQTLNATDPIYSSLATDPDLEEIVQMFVEEMPDRTAAVVERFEASDWDGLRRLAHQLKGSAGSYGYTPISRCAAELERTLNQGEPEPAIHEAVDSLIAMCGRAAAGHPEKGVRTIFLLTSGQNRVACRHASPFATD